MFDDDKPKPKPVLFTPPLLAPLSLDDLKHYVTLLDQEKQRVAAEIARKEAHAATAAALFGKKT